MTYNRFVEIIFFALVTVNGVAHAQTVTQDSFESKLYGLSQISHFGIDSARYAVLAPVQRDSVLRARAVLLEVLRALQKKDGKPTGLLTDSFKHKYPTRQALASILLEPETSLLALLITDFKVSDDSSKVELIFSVVLSSEGMVVVGNKKATLVAALASWRLADLE